MPVPAPCRLAVVLSHPTQYYSPWFRHLAARPELELKVFYLWNFGVTTSRDRTFGTAFAWDIPLLDGYDHEFLPNRSHDPGSHHFRGLDNPGAEDAIRRWKPDALLMFGYNHATHLRLILSRRLRHVPFLFRGDSHELCPARGWKPAVARKLRGLLFRRFHRFLAVGQANAEYFRRSGVADERITVVPHCVDNDRFRSRSGQSHLEAAAWKRELAIPEAATVILFAGKFEEKKRPDDLLRAFLALPEAAPEAVPVVLLLVGAGPLETTLHELAGNHAGHSIFFAPFQNQTRMPIVYACGDLLVLPSYGRGETWGLAVNEAMNLAKPVVVSSHVGCGPDLVIPGQSGWIFPAGDFGALCEVLEEALSAPQRLRIMGERAAERIKSYSYEAAATALVVALGR